MSGEREQRGAEVDIKESRSVCFPSCFVCPSGPVLLRRTKKIPCSRETQGATKNKLGEMVHTETN